MPAPLPVDLNRTRIHEVAAPEEYTTTESFGIELENHGEATHVHLHLDDALSQVAGLTANNHYVEANATHRVRVAVDPVNEPVNGRLKIVTGYGAETVYVDVTVEPEVEEKQPVEVDETLATPQQPEPEPTALERVAGGATGASLPLVVLAAVAVVLAAGVAAVADSAVVLLGAGILIGGAVVALVLVLR